VLNGSNQPIGATKLTFSITKNSDVEAVYELYQDNDGVLHVPGEYPTIQDAIHISRTNETVLVESGLYMENIDFKGKAVTVRSAQNPESTIIDGNQSGSCVTFKSNEGSSSVLEGFTLRNGHSINGGGIFCSGASPTIIANRFTQNSAMIGGGLYLNDSDIDLCNNIFYGNNAGQTGGAATFVDSDVNLINNTIIQNISQVQGGGIACLGGVLCQVSNTILWDNTAPAGSQIIIKSTANPSSATIDHSDVEGGQAAVALDSGCTLIWGTKNINQDPLFADPYNADFHLTYPSLCRDKGDNFTVFSQYDNEGDPRIAHGKSDIGADEFFKHLYWTGNPTPGGNIALKLTDIPGVAPVILWIGSGVLNPPFFSKKYGYWYLQSPMLAQIYLGIIPSPSGAVEFPYTLDPNFPVIDIQMQALIGKGLTNLCVMKIE